MRRRILLSILLIAALLGTGALGFWALVHYAPPPPRRAAERPMLIVRGVRIEPQEALERLSGFGTARARRFARVAAEVAGTVVERSEQLEVGHTVLAGTVLVRIDERDYRQQLARAEAQLQAAEAQLAQVRQQLENVRRLIEIARRELEIAERDYQRVADLFEQQRATRRELDLARGELERARRVLQQLENDKALLPAQIRAAEATRALRQADVAQARLNLERCTVRAPFDGRITQVAIEQGETVARGQVLFAILDPRRIEVAIELPVSLRDRVHVGAAATLRLENSPLHVWRARVERIDPQADAQTRTFSLYLEWNGDDDAPHPLLPGMFVQAIVDGPVLHDALVIPRDALANDTVFVFQDGQARRRRVRVERRLLDRCVVSGLRPGEIVITSNLDALYDGMPVRVVTEAAATHPAASAGASP